MLSLKGHDIPCRLQGVRTKPHLRRRDLFRAFLSSASVMPSIFLNPLIIACMRDIILAAEAPLRRTLTPITSERDVT